MKSDTRISHSLLKIAELLFSQARAFGQFALGQETTEEWLDEAFSLRLGFIHSYFTVLEEVANLRFEEHECPLLYNTQQWTPGAAPAGYAGAEAGVKPSQMLTSYLGAWHYYWIGKRKSQSSSIRPIKAALWVCGREGLTSALKYLLDLQKNGLILEASDTFNAIDALVRAHGIVHSDKEIPALFFGGRVPQTEQEWIDSEISRPALDGWLKQQRPEDFLLPLLEAGTQEIESVRSAKTYDEWLVGQWNLRPLMDVVEEFFSIYGKEISISVQSILDQFEEIRADAGAIKHAYHGRFSGHPLLFNRIPSSTMSLLFKHQFPSDWKLRLVQERTLVPYALEEQLTSETQRPLPPEWAMISTTLAPVFSLVVLRNNSFWVSRKSLFSAEEVRARSGLAIKSLEEQGILDAELQMMLVQLMGKQDGSGARGRDEQLRALKATAQYADADSETIDTILSKMTLALCLDEIQRGLDEALALRERDARLVVLNSLLENYPWCDFLYYEAGIAYDESGEHARALSHIETAIVLRPIDAMRWHSLAVVLNHLGHREEATVALGIKAMLESRKTPEG